MRSYTISKHDLTDLCVISLLMFPSDMMTSSNGNISTLLALCAGNSLVVGDFPSKRPVARSFDVFFDLCLNKRLSKQSWAWWFATPSHSTWRHCNGIRFRWKSQYVLIQIVYHKILQETSWKMLQCDNQLLNYNKISFIKFMTKIIEKLDHSQNGKIF